MAKLVITQKDTVVGNYFIEKTRMTIGRKPDNDIVLDDPGVSKAHAAILTVGNDHIFEDLGSTNGSTVNGTRINRHILQNGDTIGLDGFQLKYINAKANPDMDFDRTMMIRTVDREIGAAARSGEKGDVRSVQTARPSRRANFPLGSIKDLNGKFGENETELEQSLKTFGTPGRQVALIMRRPQGYFIAHVEGNKPARVNGKTISQEEFQALQDGDVIEVAQEKLEFYLVNGK